MWLRKAVVLLNTIYYPAHLQDIIIEAICKITGQNFQEELHSWPFLYCLENCSAIYEYFISLEYMQILFCNANATCIVRIVLHDSAIQQCK